MSPELSAGEETAGESKVGWLQPKPRHYTPWPARWEASADGEYEEDVNDALNRKTDTTLVLLAAPSHSGKVHAIASCAICQDVELLNLLDLNIHSALVEVAARRCALRFSLLLEQLLCASSSPHNGSPLSSSEAREGELRHAPVLGLTWLIDTPYYCYLISLSSQINAFLSFNA